MGVPAFFRWLSGNRKYPSVVVHCVEQKPKEVNGVKAPVDSSQPNPNDIEFDNLYLDMNGIIHPCCHPEDRPAPKNEDEMMVLIFEYIDRIFSIVRPRKVLYMAIDGVAPRAKMNQQRSRRFRASKEAVEGKDEIARLREELTAKGYKLLPPKPAGEHFDSNCITPGTPFMFRLADCLRYYIHDRLNNDPGWQDIKVILSDANVPGEGEHKIMDFIRKQRAQPDHDPNTHHCLCGADADLIMLGLATHEPNFTIIREEFKPNKPRPCDLCGQLGHENKECEGLPREQSDAPPPLMGEETDFIFLRLNILREYLERELKMDGLPFTYNFERALDDWVFMCFFVGNDFLPHLPSLEIREGAIDRLVNLYKKTVRKTGGYLTDSGVVNLSRVQLIMQDLGEMEDEIFKKRRDTELGFRKRNKEKRKRMKREKEAKRPNFIPGGQFAPTPLGRNSAPSTISNPRQEAYKMRTGGAQYSTSANQDAASALRSMITDGRGQSQDQKGTKRPADSDSDPEPEDDVKLWEDGFKDRYYKNKFDVDEDDIEFRHTVAKHYVIGLCWVLRYYYQGCASWKWYFPYHYAPFASDFVNIAELPNDFERNTVPFQPLEQLMGVFPAASKQHLPITWQRLMMDPESPIIDFYPIDFKIDLNGKKFAWQGVALLPFVDEKRLKKSLETVYPDLTSAEQKRNIRGDDRLFVGGKHPAHSFLEGLYEGGKTKEPVEVNPKECQGMAGTSWSDDFAVMVGGVYPSPLPALQDITDNRAISVHYSDPKYESGFLFKAEILPGAVFPPKTLKPEDFNQRYGNQQYRPQLGFQRDSGYRNRGDKDISSALRMIRSNTGRGAMGAVPPPLAGVGYNQRGSQQYGRQQGAYNNPDSSSSRYGGQSGNMGWQRNMQAQASAYQRHSGYGQGGYSQGGQGGYSQGGYSQGGYQQQQGQYNQGGYGGQQGNRQQDGWNDDRRRNYPQSSNYRRY